MGGSGPACLYSGQRIGGRGGEELLGTRLKGQYNEIDFI